MLALPGFDTYGTLRQFASDPYDPGALLGLGLLKARASTARIWDTFSMLRPGMNLKEILDLRTGSGTDDTAVGNDVARIMSGKVKTEEEREDIYMKMCREVGLDITKEMLDLKQQMVEQEKAEKEKAAKTAESTEKTPTKPKTIRWL